MDYESIKKLIDDMGNSKLSSLEIDFPDGTKINMKKGINQNCFENKNLEEKNDIARKNSIECASQNIVYKNIDDEEKSNSKINANIEDEKIYKYVKSPMVGTFYSSPSPDAEAFVEIGSTVNKGDVVCIIEAMKLMNEIKSDFSGKVTQICVKNGDPIEYGQVLMYVE